MEVVLTVTIEIPLPPAALAQPKGHWRSKSGPTKAQRQEACLLARGQAPAAPWAKAVVHWHILFPDLRRRDVYNVIQGCKGAIDGIVDAGVIVDDCWTHLRPGRHEVGVDALNPRVIITVEPAP